MSAAPTRVVYDFTIYADDGETPLFGSAYLGELTESDFQTPDPDLPHDRPYLLPPANFSGAHIDFLNGSSTIGTVSVGALDKRTDAADQASGQLTARIEDTVGKRAVLRRRVEGVYGAEWVKLFEGVVHTYSVDPEQLLLYWFHLRDAREFERAQPLFFSNYVIFGETFTHKGKTYPKHGPSTNYGALPGGGHMITAVEPFGSVVDGGVTHFKRGDPMEWFDREVFWGVTPGLAAVPDFNLVEFWSATPADDGFYYFEEFWIRWRAKGSADPWTELRDMPRAFPTFPVHAPYTDIPNYSEGGAASFLRFSVPTLYFGSFTEADIPADDQEIEYQIMASRITPTTPFWWDGGTLGDLLQEIVDGEHTLELPGERYDVAALAAFAAEAPPARFILRQPVTDRRKWVEENIYKPALRAPAFNDELAIYPVSWAAPENDESIALLDADTVHPVGDWEHGTGNAVGEVEYTYTREHLEDQRKVTEDRTKKILGFIPYGTRQVEVNDVTQMEWERLIEDQVPIQRFADNPLPGAKKVTFSPVTIRTTTDVFGRPQDVGDSRDFSAVFLVYRTIEEAFRLYAGGAPRYEALLDATAANLAFRAGDLVRLHSEYLPDYRTLRRGTGRYMRFESIYEESPEQLRAVLVDTGIPDLTIDDDGEEPAEDCFELSGGVLYPAAEGVLRVFYESGWLTNNCDHAITLPALIEGGGGGGGDGDAGGGGGEGQLKGADENELEITIAAGESVWIEVGEGGPVDSPGGQSVVWVDDDGQALDPMTDTEPATRTAVGGGEGGGGGEVGGGGGSGGAAGGDLPISGGGADVGGSAADPLYGHDGGGGSGSGGIATCQRAVGGGGGSYLEAGDDGEIGTPSIAGVGGAGYMVPVFGLQTGGGGQGGVAHVRQASGDECGSDLAASGRAGVGFGAGGGGAALGAGATPGSDGVVAFLYTGPRAPLVPPEITSTETTDQNQQTICVQGAQWPGGALDGLKVRIEYALTDPYAAEPDPSSGLWTLAGYLDAPGCVTTPPVPTGMRVWSRARAEAPGYLPSTPGSTTSADTPETPGLLALSLDIDNDGVPTLRWTENAFALALRIRGMVHVEGASTERPLTLLDDVDAADGEYVLTDPVPRGSWVTVDVEAWEDDTYTTQGRIYRRSVENPVRELVATEDGLDGLGDVTLDDVQPGDMLVADIYGEWHNQQVAPDQLAEPTDNTVNDATTGHHGLLPKLSGSASDFLDGTGEFSLPPTDWSRIVAQADADVTNSSTLQADPELTFPVTPGVYEIELFLIYGASDASADFQWGMTFPASKMTFWIQGSENAAGSGATSLALQATLRGATDLGTSLQRGTPASPAFLECTEKFTGQLIVTTSGDLTVTFANVSAAPGRVSRRFAGSALLYRKHR